MEYFQYFLQNQNRALSLEPDSYTLPLQLTPPGTLTAHGSFHLVLLCSHPDTVHGFPLRKTRTSTPLIKGSCTRQSPQSSITPTGADCRYRAPLTPRLRGLISISFFRRFVNTQVPRMKEPVRTKALFFHFFPLYSVYAVL